MCINPPSCILAKWRLKQKSHMNVELIENCYRFNVFEKNLFSSNPSPEIHYKSLPANMSSSSDHKWQVFQAKLIHVRISHKSCWFGLPCFSCCWIVLHLLSCRMFPMPAAQELLTDGIRWNSETERNNAAHRSEGSAAVKNISLWIPGWKEALAKYWNNSDEGG